jgi:hypothetical protein
MEFLRSELMILSKQEILATELKQLYFVSIWGSFRTYLREIYTPETTSSADIRANLAREKREKNKEVIGRKESGKNFGKIR